MSTSIVLPLGSGSKNNDLELRYCLRSVEKYLTGYGDVFIIGRKPDWLHNVIHIPFDEGFAPQSYEKERNIFNKIIAACGDERVSQRFLFMNDDHFLQQTHEALRFPYYCNGLLADKMTITEYKYTVKNTMDALYDRCDVPYYDVHCPIVYHKGYFDGCLKRADWDAKWGYCIKTMYCEVAGIIGDEYPDLKINEAYTVDQIKEKIFGRAWFSIGDRSFNGEIAQVLQDLYPTKSKYE